jgi:ParB family chromosome partitioning protein
VGEVAVTKGRDVLAEVLTTPAAPSLAARRPPAVVKAVGLTLGGMSAAAKDAERLRAQIEAGDQVVELDPALVDDPVGSDRMNPSEDPAFEAFKAGVAEHGQYQAILVRPSAAAEGRYEIAFGRRRLRAAAELGRPVRAVVRKMTDRELLVALGRENSDRKDLSWIERALFASRLDARGEDRETVVDALGADKPEISRMLGVVRAAPPDLLAQIGPAPKAGRPRWMELAALLADKAARARALAAAKAAAGATSDERFEAVMAAAAGRQARARAGKAVPTVLRAADGAEVARLEAIAAGLRVTSRTPAFLAFLRERLPDLVRDFEAGQGVPGPA